MVFYAEGIDIVKLEERLKKLEVYESFTQEAPPEEMKEVPKKQVPSQKGVNPK